ncbi:hypothetical protein MTR62_05285 [Novosphingobium sp. 1949]|uniref:Uncharacterized protein n=1 Tax=Novosphingobium organovorum TaxID=2930092 RepID=A0ABT0BB95_9SPHN|nr:hypothetical protein [Novosphingobium organovorum]MCJ2182118.1 hypothetical protein [Novosphingobium organovorum]
MKKIALAAFASAAALALAACGGNAPTDTASESVETVPSDMMTTDAPTEVPTEAM